LEAWIHSAPLRSDRVNLLAPYFPASSRYISEIKAIDLIIKRDMQGLSKTQIKKYSRTSYLFPTLVCIRWDPIANQYTLIWYWMTLICSIHRSFC
jgi:hypothetical protein